MSYNNYIRRIKKVLKHPRLLLSKLIMNETIGHLLSDETFLKLSYRLRMGQKLDLDNPQTFTEKIQWLKLHNRSELCTQVVDKARSKDWFLSKCETGHVIPTIGEWDHFEDIDFDSLPNKFVLKCTHDSGSVVICRDKNSFDKASAKKKLTKRLSKNYFWVGREYSYKNAQPKIIAEPLMKDEDSNDLPDFKFFCFNGQPKVLFYASGRFREKDSVPYFDYYDMDLNHLDIHSAGHDNAPQRLQPFPQFEDMKAMAATLSKDFPHVRVDFYLINGRIYFGEITFHHDGGFVPFQPESWNEVFGNWIQLPKQ